MIALTPGDPAGIGPIVLLDALRHCDFPPDIHLCGDPRIWRRAAVRASIPWTELESLTNTNSFIDPDIELPAWGQPSVAGATMAWRALDEAILDSGTRFKGIVTGPIAKDMMLQAGFPYAGHTEYLGEKLALDGSVLMVMWAPGFCVGLATAHIPLRDVCDSLSLERIAVSCRLLHTYLHQTGVEAPKIAVSGVNPHAGEGGLLGDDEAMIRRGIDASGVADFIDGPLPGDTVFSAMAQGRFDAVLAMYHDQGLAPFKLRHFHDGVNVTVGLNIVRTSPDHGTAFALAREGGHPESGSAVAALALARQLSRE